TRSRLRRGEACLALRGGPGAPGPYECKRGPLTAPRDWPCAPYRSSLAASVWLLPGARELALRLLPLQDPAAGRASLRALPRRGRVSALSLSRPAPAPRPAAGGGRLRGPAGAGHTPLQVRGLAGPGATAGPPARGPPGGRRGPGRRAGAGPALRDAPQVPRLQPGRADRPRAGPLAAPASRHSPGARARHAAAGRAGPAPAARQRFRRVCLAGPGPRRRARAARRRRGDDRRHPRSVRDGPQIRRRRPRNRDRSGARSDIVTPTFPREGSMAVRIPGIDLNEYYAQLGPIEPLIRDDRVTEVMVN